MLEFKSAVRTDCTTVIVEIYYAVKSITKS